MGGWGNNRMADDDPRGFYARFRTTPKMIFGTEPDRKIERQRKFIETYLTLLAEYLMRRLYLERDEAEDLVLDFMGRLFASPAIRENAWGKYRYYIAKAVFRFASRRLIQKARQDRRRLTARQWLAISYAELSDRVIERVFSLELVQIRRGLAAGLFDDYLNHAVEEGEIASRDVGIWVLSAHQHMDRREIAASRRDVTKDGVKRALQRVDLYLRKHAKELRLILHEL